MIVGVGSTEPQLLDARSSYENADRAAHVAELVPRYRPVSRSDDLGVYGMLAALPLAELRRKVVHPGLRRLREAEPDLLETLELFLDRAGDTKVVADELGVHRSTVYYRLKRIEEIVGEDLNDGESRLALHLGLKVDELARPT